MTSASQRGEFAASRISGCGRRLISMRQLCRIVSNALGTRCTAGAEMAPGIFRFRTIEIGRGIVFNRTVCIHTNRLDGETATNGRRVGMSGCCASKELGRRTTRGGRLLCKQDSQVGSIPTRSTNIHEAGKQIIRRRWSEKPEACSNTNSERCSDSGRVTSNPDRTRKCPDCPKSARNTEHRIASREFLVRLGL